LLKKWRKKCINSSLRDSKSHRKVNCKPRNTRFCQRKINTMIYLFKNSHIVKPTVKCLGTQQFCKKKSKNKNKTLHYPSSWDYYSCIEKSIEEANDFLFVLEKKKYKTIPLSKLPKVSFGSQEVGARRRRTTASFGNLAPG